DPFRMGIAIMPRIAEQRAIAAKQGKIDAPGIDTNAIGATVFRGALPECLQHVRVQPQDIPMQRVQGADRAVRETVYDLQVEPMPIELPQHAAAALRTQVKSQKFLIHRW